MVISEKNVKIIARSLAFCYMCDSVIVVGSIYAEFAVGLI